MNSNETTYPEILTVKQLSQLLQIPLSSMYERIARKEIPGVQRIGKHLRIHRDTVLQWLSGDSRVLRS